MKILLVLLIPFVQNPSKELHQQALSQLSTLCETTIECDRVQLLADLFNDQQYDSAYTILVEKSTRCEKEACFLFLILKAKVFYEKGLVKQAIDQYKEAIATREKLDKPFYRHFAIEPAIASLLVEQEKFKESIHYLKGWLMENELNIGNEQLKGYLHNLGISYLHTKKYDSSEYYLLKSIAIEQEIKDTLGLAISYMDIANLYYEQYMDDKAIPLFIKALEYTKLKKEEKPEVLRNAYLNMAVVEENRNDYKKAIGFRKEYEAIQKELWNRDKVWELAEKDKQYEVNLRDKEIAVLEEQERTQKAELTSQQWQINTYLSVAFFLFVIAGISGWGYRKVKRSNRLIFHQKKELEKLNNTKNRLFTIIAHDLKSPVISLQKSQQKIAQAISNKDESKINEITSENELLLDNTHKLLNNTLQWALDQTNQLQFSLETIDVKRLIDIVLYDYSGLVESKKITLDKAIEPGIMISVDLQSTKTALRNLLDNAVKFTPSGGSILVSSQIVNERVRIVIRDSGCGIDPERLDKLFEVNSAKIQKDTTGRTGTGLGLMLSKTLIERNGGILSVRSEVQHGTSMIIDLPEFIPSKDYPNE